MQTSSFSDAAFSFFAEFSFAALEAFQASCFSQMAGQSLEDGMHSDASTKKTTDTCAQQSLLFGRQENLSHCLPSWIAVALSPSISPSASEKFFTTMMFKTSALEFVYSKEF